jgi:hypothetical protein
MKRRWGILIGISIALAWGVSCTRGPAASPTDYRSLVDALQAEGATVEPGGAVAQPFFAVEPQVITVNGAQVQVYEFTDTASAEAAAARVSADGSTVGSTMITWIAPPHFYRSGRLVVLYVGDNEVVLSLLQSVLGEQFAGQ